MNRMVNTISILRHEKRDFQIFKHLTHIFNAVLAVFCNPVTVEPDAQADPRRSDDPLLRFIFQEILNVSVFPIPVYGVIGDIHLPENAVLCQCGKICERIQIHPFEIRKQIGMRNACGTAAAFRKRDEIRPADTAFRQIDMFHKAIIEIGNIFFRLKAQITDRCDFDSSAQSDPRLVCCLKFCQKIEI